MRVLKANTFSPFLPIKSTTETSPACMAATKADHGILSSSAGAAQTGPVHSLPVYPYLFVTDSGRYLFTVNGQRESRTGSRKRVSSERQRAHWARSPVDVGPAHGRSRGGVRACQHGADRTEDSGSCCLRAGVRGVAVRAVLIPKIARIMHAYTHLKGAGTCGAEAPGASPAPLASGRRMLPAEPREVTRRKGSRRTRRHDARPARMACLSTLPTERASAWSRGTRAKVRARRHILSSLVDITKKERENENFRQNARNREATEGEP